MSHFVSLARYLPLVGDIFYLKKIIWTVRLETRKVMVYVCMAQVTEGACQNGVEGVETLQAAEPPCSVSNGPMKINVKTSASGGLIYKTKH